MTPRQDEVPGFAEIHRRFGPWIRSRVRRTFSDDWEDVVQESLLRLGRALTVQRDFRDEPLRALISRVVRSTCVDEMRRRMRRPPAGVRAEDVAADTASDGPAPSDAAAHADEIDRLRRDAWGRLDGREREILTLRFRDGLGFREIAARLSIPQGSAAGWYSRAIKTLREVLQ